MRPVLALPVGLLALLGGGCADDGSPRPLPVAGDAERGRAALERFDCEACHVIPGVRGLPAHMGPSLEQYARRAYLAGKFPNEQHYLVRWIVDAPALAPATAMPAIGVSEAEALDMAAYLLTLR